jgi:GT2 family glycosyltransferase
MFGTVTTKNGEYIYFEDARAQSAPDYLEKLTALADSSGADIVLCGLSFNFEKKATPTLYQSGVNLELVELAANTPFIQDFIENEPSVFMVNGAKLFKKSFVTARLPAVQDSRFAAYSLISELIYKANIAVRPEKLYTINFPSNGLAGGADAFLSDIYALREFYTATIQKVKWAVENGCGGCSQKSARRRIETLSTLWTPLAIASGQGNNEALKADILRFRAWYTAQKWELHGGKTLVTLRDENKPALPLASILVPVYNCADYLERCLDSLCSQTYTNIEIVIVDDGSTDGSSAILDKYAAKDARFNIFTRKNGGIASARNQLLDLAAGEYIAFVDSDDFVPGDYIEKLIAPLLERGCDIAVCGYRNVIEEGYKPTYMNTAKVKHSGLVTRDVVFEEFSSNLAMNLGTLWAKLFKRSLFDGLRFRLGMLVCEDYFILTDVYLRARSVYILQDDMYAYFLRGASLSHVKMPTDTHYTNFLDAIQYKITRAEAEGLHDISYFMDCRLLEGLLESWEYKLDNFGSSEEGRDLGMTAARKELEKRRAWFAACDWVISNGGTRKIA